MTLSAEIVEALKRDLYPTLDTQHVRVELEFARNIYPMNGFVNINGKPTFDFIVLPGKPVIVYPCL